MSATIDYGDKNLSAGSNPPRVFFGRKVSLTELGLEPRVAHPRLILVPELSRPKGVELWLDVGDEGELDGTRFGVIGMVSRSLGNQDDRVAWEEYLLHNAHVGVRWLVLADGHWSLVEPINAGLVQEAREDGATRSSTTLFGDTYEVLLSDGVARLDWAAGELPWEIKIGEVANVRDFVRPPWILSKEWSTDELSWARGVYVEPDTIAKAFGKRALPKPEGRAPNQPAPAKLK